MKQQVSIYTSSNKPTENQKSQIAEFLFDHLDQFGDSKIDILKSINYSLKECPSFGGFVITKRNEHEIIGAVVVNQTGMNGYIPDNVLVYIAVHRDLRGQGLGKELILTAINLAKGDIALHVEPDNPAKFLYSNIGFKSKYLEMRYKKENN